MLTVGTRTYELVRAHSGFFLELDPEWVPESTQQWRMDTHWVASPDHAPVSADNYPEYLRLTVTADRYRRNDWRELTGLGLDDSDDTAEDGLFYGEGRLEYLLDPERKQSWEPLSLKLILGTMDVCWKEGYLFSCEFDATVKFDEDRKEDLVMVAELPFAGVSMNVPINGNAVAIGHVRAQREIGPVEISGGQVIPHDWRRTERNDPEATLDSTRRVMLHTPWRQRLV